MSTEILREAAALMRERAKAAEPGPWESVQGSSGGWWVERPSTATIADIDNDYSGNPGADAEHIASWHPAVALAVADWLTTAGADLWAHGPLCCEDGCMKCDDDLWAPHVRRALAVARAYLGRDV